LCGLLAVTVAGCVPFLTFIDFTPEMAGGKILTSNCVGKQSVEYEIGGIRLASTMAMWSPTGDNAPLLYVFIDIPAGTRVELLSRDVSVLSPPSAEIKRVPIPGFRIPKTPAQAQNRLPATDRGEVNFRDLTATNSFAIDVPLRGMPVGDFRIQLPDMKINDRTFKIPPIDFKRFRRVEIMAPLNC
jgi:hypothetical protein